MHATYISTIGSEVIEEQEHQIIGIVSDLLLDPDKGMVVALIVASQQFTCPAALLCMDLLSWGKRIHISSEDKLAPLEDIIRLQALLADRRTLIGQKIRTKSGMNIGTCVDVQFDTDAFTLEWLFPRKFLRMGTPLPASEILEVTPDAIIIRDPELKEEVSVSKPIESSIDIDPVIRPATNCAVDPQRSTVDR